MNTTYDYDVFLSYSAKDKKPVRALARRLQDDGLRVWLDERAIEPGQMVSPKIQEGLEQSRRLLLCMSPAYFDSEWGTLEHHTLLFRDPTNAQRRFIPLLLADCTPPGIIALFAHIDWRTPSDKSYTRLLSACRGEEAETPEGQAQEEQAVQQSRVLEGHTAYVVAVAITPDGKTVVSGSTDNTLKVWDLESGQCRATFEDHTNSVWHMALTPDGKTVVSGSTDSTLKVWDLESGQCRATFEGHTDSVTFLAITPDGKTVVSGSADKTLRVWDLESGQCRATFERHTGFVLAVAIMPDGKTVVSGSADKTLRVWDLESGQCRATFEDHTDYIHGVSVTPDGKTVVSCSDDETLKVWDLESGQCRATFEGHTNGVWHMALTPDGKTVVSGSVDKTSKVWDLESGQCRATFKGHTDRVTCVAITPDGKTVVSSSWDWTLRVWDLPEPDKSVEEAEATRYTNAKVVLVGESGVGKTGLAIRLREDRFEATISTDAHWATRFMLPQETDSDDIDREIWLWDFAGQADYRLIHQLFMDETELAVLIFNPQNENLFEGLGQWDGDLEKAARRPFKKLLVAGRCDRGGLMVTKKSIEDFRDERGFDRYLETSAQTGVGCDDLRDVIIATIDWDAIPWTASSKVFKALKDEIIKLREEGLVLLRMVELKQQLDMRLSDEKFTMEELRAVVGLLAGPGLVWKLEFGDFVLLQPERINAYASAVVRKIRKHPDDIGCILEEDILNANLDFQNMDRLPPFEEAMVLRAMHQTFVDHGICLREETDEGRQLVLPSYFKRERPELEGHPAVIVSYHFAGGLDEIYASLIVRLHYTTAFDNDRLWKFAADFKTQAGKQVGVKMDKKREGRAELIVYCHHEIPADTKVTFIKYVHEHLLRKGKEVRRYRHYVCPHCGHPVRDSELTREILEDEGRQAQIRCQRRKCDKLFNLWDLIEKKFAAEEFQQRVRVLEAQAQAGIDSESKELILVGHAYAIAGEAGQIYRQYTNSDHGIDGEIEFKDNTGKASGNRLYLQLKSGDSYLTTRKRDGAEIFRLKKQRWAQYWLNQPCLVMLVIRTSDGTTRWMNVTDYLEEHGTAIRQIVFKSEPFTALKVARMRDRVLE